MKPLNLLVLVCAFAALTLPMRASSYSPCGSVAGNLATNCGFEEGDFTGWTTSANSSYSYVYYTAVYDYAGPNSGGYFALLSPGYRDGTLSQTLSTSAGTEYTIAFYFASEGD